MSPARAFGSAVALIIGAALIPTPSLAQSIDFETIPGGGNTVDQQLISTEYAVYGVTFALLSRTTGLPIGSPRIAKAGAPQTAFEGCVAPDTPRPNLGLGSSFLTDGTSLGVEGDLRVDYAAPVAQAAGVILDIDCRVNGGPPCEQWTVTAYDASGSPLQTVVLDAPQGAPNPECVDPPTGPGDSEAFGWSFDVGTPQIQSIVLRYTGVASDVGLAFDNFSVSSLPGPPDVEAVSPADTICAGESLTLEAAIAGGLPPYTYQWQQEGSPSNWIDLGTGSSQQIQPLTTGHYRVVVTDALAHQVTSASREVVVKIGGPLCTTGLLVSSYYNDRVVRYSFQSGLPEVLVTSGLGGLSGPSELTCRDDGNLYVVDQANNRVLRYAAATGAFVDIFVAAGSGGLNVPVGLDFGPDGSLYVASYSTSSVLRYDGVTGAFIDAFVPTGSGLNGPTGIVFGPDGNLYVCSREGDKVLYFDGTTGVPLGDFVTAGSGGLDAPRGLTFGPDGHLYVAEEVHDAVSRYDGTTGAFIDVFVAAGSGGLDRANDVAFGPDGMLYVASVNTDQVLCYDGASGAFVRALPGGVLDGPAWLAAGCPSASVDVPRGAIPRASLTVGPNVPNPFSPRTTVEFTLGKPGHTQVTVVDVAGRVLATLLDRPLPAGRHLVAWDGRLADGRAAVTGVYFLRVRSGGAVQGLKMVLLR
jgi:sugar lactone lactonase YvrE